MKPLICRRFERSCFDFVVWHESALRPILSAIERFVVRVYDCFGKPDEILTIPPNRLGISNCGCGDVVDILAPYVVLRFNATWESSYKNGTRTSADYADFLCFWSSEEGGV
jgi:hypothetical protein